MFNVSSWNFIEMRLYNLNPPPSLSCRGSGACGTAHLAFNEMLISLLASNLGVSCIGNRKELWRVFDYEVYYTTSVGLRFAARNEIMEMSQI